MTKLFAIAIAIAGLALAVATAADAQVPDRRAVPVRETPSGAAAPRPAPVELGLDLLL